MLMCLKSYFFFVARGILQLKIQLFKDTHLPTGDKRTQSATMKDEDTSCNVHETFAQYIVFMLNSDNVISDSHAKAKWDTLYSLLEMSGLEIQDASANVLNNSIALTLLNPDERNIHEFAPRIGDALLEFASAFSE